MDPMAVVRALLRWAHVFVGIIWIGHLYFFNWVNGPFAATMDKDTKQKVVPELMPRALFWFRWGAAWTWFFGYCLLGMVFYMAKTTLFEQTPGVAVDWGPGAGVMAMLVLIAPFLYDALCKSPLGKNNQTFAITGLVLVAGLMWAYTDWAHFSYRAALIHLGATSARSWPTTSGSGSGRCRRRSSARSRPDRRRTRRGPRSPADAASTTPTCRCRWSSRCSTRTWPRMA